MDYVIRFAQKEDIPQIIELCAAHATYEKATYDRKHKEKLWIKHLFSKEKAFICLVVETKKKLIGYTTFMKQYSTWDSQFYIYLDCLYLNENTRGMGIGLKLMDKVKQYAISQHCDCIQWQTPIFNTPAIQFYQRLGALSKQKERFIWKV
ncbi:GNAT family N-acetyltransferase [Aquimarina addita]|uniref:GNAT family N-acetyltransferase n=1 Tax=Aquimarina addita TaxID=870485 RepID=A0ABP7XBE9_9FLAO